METEENYRNGSQKLNVIFHGAIAFDQISRPDRILALIPLIDHHVYLAGNWLAETQLRGRTGEDSKDIEYQLIGVDAGYDRFKPGQTLIVHPRQTCKPQARPYATLNFPLPETITPTLVGSIPLDALTNHEDLLVSSDPQPMATMQVFTYNFRDENDVMLNASDGNGHYWQPVVVDGHINLHIFAAEDQYHHPSNAEEDFNKCADLFGGLNLRLKTESLPASRVLARQPLPHGVDERESESLAHRTERMARLGRLVLQNGGDANVAWFGNDALDGDPEACTGPVID